MPLYKGNTKIKTIYKGYTKIVKIYKGSNLIYTGLPSAYQEVEYIESSGTQYINTGVIPNINTKIEVSVLYEINKNGFPAVVSSENDTNGPVEIVHWASGPSWTGMFGGGIILQSYVAMLQRGVYNNVSLNKDKFVINGTEYNVGTTSLTTTKKLWLMYALFSQGQAAEGYIRIKNCKLYDNDVLIRDFVPCYRKSDNEIGLYDLVNDTFYTNAGTGTFLKGNDV